MALLEFDGLLGYNDPNQCCMFFKTAGRQMCWRRRDLALLEKRRFLRSAMHEPLVLRKKLRLQQDNDQVRILTQVDI